MNDEVVKDHYWDTKLTEARESIRAELREEFAQRYEHDKSVMVDALDNMVTEALSSEIAEFAEEKQALAEDRVKFKRYMSESAGKFDNFMVTKLAEEIKELREDRKQYQNSIAALEKFVIKALAEEIKEFEQDKQAVVEARVRLVQEAKQKLAELKTQFIQRSSRLVKEAVATNLETELTQLKEDIQVARENMFGRRLFEAFASEFAVTHLNENKEIAKLQEEATKRAAELRLKRAASEQNINTNKKPEPVSKSASAAGDLNKKSEIETKLPSFKERQAAMLEKFKPTASKVEQDAKNKETRRNSKIEK